MHLRYWNFLCCFMCGVCGLSSEWFPGESMSPKELTQLRSVPPHTNKDFDCAVRKYAYEYAQKLQSWRGAIKMKEVFDSLELATLCNQAFDPSIFSPTPVIDSFEINENSLHVYVCPNHGNDTTAELKNEKRPFRSINHAVSSLRGWRSDLPAVVILRAGIHRLTNTLELTPEDSFLTFVNYPGEEASLSGAMPLKTDWKPFNTKKGMNIYVTDLSGQKVNGITGLRVGGNRSARAGYPNRDPELSLFPTGWINGKQAKWRTPIPPKTNVTFVTIEDPILHDKTMFQKYMVGVKGHCELYDPPVSYWCSENPSGGGAFAFRVPSGLTYNESVPLKEWKNPKGAILNVWRPNHWANWMFELDEYDYKTRTIGWSKGGFQGARGDNKGAEWFVENVFEELDSPNEYFYDTESQKLYYFYNGTGPPSAELLFESCVNQTIVSLKGTQTKPVKEVNFTGITFRDSAYTYMEPHGVPSGGDWGLQRFGAIFLEGTEKVTINQCLVTRVDSNAVMISGYNRDLVISNNEFVWIGDSVIASWGYTAPLGTKEAGDKILAQYKSGIDGTGGDQPRGTHAVGNFIHELGHFEKQSSPWFQAKSCQNVISKNIMFNMPRAAINFNDGFGGGSEISENLSYNSCRESGDHAVFNSWDRQPFLTKVGQTPGKLDLNPAYNNIHKNFFIGNYNAAMAIDNDDGSSYYKIHHNFEVYGGHKSNFGGHNKLRYGAINAFAKVYQEGLCCRVNAVNIGNYTDGYYNNTCIQSRDGMNAYTFRMCDPKNPFNVSNIGVLHDNKIYNPSGKMSLECGKTKLSETQFQKSGADKGTTVSKTPKYNVIIGWARQMLEG